MYVLQLHSLLPCFCCLLPQLFPWVFFSLAFPWWSPFCVCLFGFAHLTVLLWGLRLIAEMTRKTPFLQALSWPLVFNSLSCLSRLSESTHWGVSCTRCAMLHSLWVAPLPLLLLHVSGYVPSSTAHNKKGTRRKRVTLLGSSLFFLHLCMLLQNFRKLSRSTLLNRDFCYIDMVWVNTNWLNAFDILFQNHSAS